MMKDIIYQSDWNPKNKTTEINLKIGCDVVAHGGLTGSCIHDLEVKQEYRRQGFATEILRILVLMGGSWLWCDWTNIPAVKLYEKFGFEITELDGGFYKMCLPQIRMKNECK